jgi:hypothetical protein
MFRNAGYLYTTDAAGNTTALSGDPNFNADDQGLKAWTYDPVLAVNGTAPTAGQLNLVAVLTRVPISVSNVWLGIVTATGVSLTSGQCFVGIYDHTGTLVASTADLSGVLNTSGMKECALTSSVNLAPGRYWVGILLNGGTMPSMARSAGTISGLGNVGLTSTQYRFGTYGTAQTSLPSTITTATIGTTSTNTFWAGVV